MIEFKKEYPLAFKALENSKKYTTFTKFEKAINIIEECLEKEEIISTQVADLKYLVNLFIDDSYTCAISSKYLHNGAYKSQNDSMAYIDIPSEARFINSFSKKLKKIPLLDQNEMYKDCVTLTEELMNIYQVMEYLKEHTIKASDKKKQEQEIKKEEADIWLKKFTSHEDSQKVILLLKQTASNIENTIYINYVKQMERTVKIYQEAQINGESDYKKIFKNNGYAQMIMQTLCERDFEKGDYKNPHFKLRDKYQEKLDSEAKKMASDIVNNFVYKNSNKLSYIVYNKNNLDNVTITNVDLSYGTIQCDVNCQFKDGSSFIANTSVVLSYSKYNKPFYRYPTIFQNVVLPGGSALTGVSEQKMDEVFSIMNIDNDIKVPRKIKIK